MSDRDHDRDSVFSYDDIKVMNEKGKILPPGKDGELVAKGPGIFTGYLKAEAENAKAFTRSGYFRTGDMARIDKNGNVVITGRIKDIIIRGGENISAVEVEEALVRHPDVEQASAVGMPDKEMGEKVCAYIRTKAERLSPWTKSSVSQTEPVSVLFPRG
jgi:2,3-dihydroxybenzoate-AMP ligase/mycobactin salicyl-AMP ligase